VVIGVPKSGNRLHEMLLTAVTRAPFYFFTSTDNGITLNRYVFLIEPFQRLTGR